MREIEFRAWDREKNVMVYGIERAYDTLSSHPITDASGKKLDWYNDTSFCRMSCFGDFLNDESVPKMQYTGLRDRNGRKIYEGDILKAQTEGKAWVGDVFSSNGSVWLRTPSISRLDDAAMLFCIPNCEVIGNVHENPELLEKK